LTTQLFLDLYLAKFLDTSVKPFFLCMEDVRKKLLKLQFEGEIIAKLIFEKNP